MSKRISLFVPSLRGGGAQKVMVTLANGFAARGYKTDLVLAKAEGPYLDDVSDKTRLVDLDAGRVMTSIPGLSRYIRQCRPSVLLSALTHANIAAVTARLASQVPTRIVVSNHNNFLVSLQNERPIRRSAILHLMRWAYSKTDAVVAVSGGVANILAEKLGLPQNHIRVVYNPIITPKLLELSRAPVDHSWFNSGEPPVILGVGRLTPQKNFHLLIKAFAKLRMKRRARLMILGEGPLRAELEALAQELKVDKDLLLPGFMENPYAYMRRASLFVLSSGWEGFGNVIVETMACGTPVVSTDCVSGPAEILENGKWGTLVSVGDIDGLAQAMNDTLDSPKNSYAEARANEFSCDKAVEIYLSILFPRNSSRETGSRCND